MEGFFSESELVESEPSPTIAKCGLCKLCRSCNSPKMQWTGCGYRKILVVAEAPGENEDREGTQLIGKAGQKLRECMQKLGVDLDRDCWKTNAVICRSEETPTERQIVACRPNLLRTIEELHPEVILLLGAVAVKSLIGHLWRKSEDPGKIGRWVGWKIPCQQLNAWVCPTWHPSYLLRKPDPVLELWFDRHLEEAFKLKEAPYPEGTPDYPALVERILDDAQAAKVIRKMIEHGGTVAFDYETDRLKPDHPDARIVSCGVCWEGKKTIAYPWYGDAIKATSELLRSPSKKYGWNLKFEQRWTKALLGHGVRNWEWDGMLAAHTLDNRQGITSAKFQAFVLLGLSPWDRAIKPYLRAEESNKPNRIGELPLDDLLLYNGIDALVTFEMASKQRKVMENECR